MEEKEMTKEEKQTGEQEETGFGLNVDENMAGTTNIEDKVTEESELEKLKSELREKDDKYLRLYAEFDNFKKRTYRETLEIRQTAGREVIQSLLEVLDDCDRAEQQMQKNDDPEVIRQGVPLIFNKLRKTLQSKGLKELKSIGEPFNVDLHEAITEIPVTDTDMDGRIVDEVEKGYFLNDKLIRFSKVVVGKKP